MLHWFAIAAYCIIQWLKTIACYRSRVCGSCGARLIQPGLGWAALLQAAAVGFEQMLLPVVLWISGDDSASCISYPLWTSKLARACFPQVMAEVQEGKKKCMRPFQAWRSHAVTSAYVSLDSRSHMAKPKVMGHRGTLCLQRGTGKSMDTGRSEKWMQFMTCALYAIQEYYIFRRKNSFFRAVF